MSEEFWNSFGLLEWGLCLEIIILLTAAFFYQVAKFIARTDRHDPLVRFYRVFWRAFFSGVASFRQIELQHAEAAAMASGYGREVDNLDAPDLSALHEAGYAASAGSEMSQLTDRAAPPSKVRPIGKREAPPESQNVSATFDVMIRPRSGRDSILGMEGNQVVVAVQCEAEDGSANGVVIDLLAPRIGVPKYQISLIRGHYKVQKSFRVQQMDQASLNMRLQQATQDTI